MVGPPDFSFTQSPLLNFDANMGSFLKLEDKILSNAKGELSLTG
jgi:hypothetical protein